MTRCGVAENAAGSALPDIGLPGPAALLDEAPASAERRRVDVLSKPGLGGRQRWRCCVDGGDEPRRVFYVKRYGRTPLRAQWDRFMRQTWSHSAAWWEFEQSRRLAAANVPAVSAVAFAEDMLGPIERRSAVMLDAVPGDALDRTWQRLIQAGHPRTHGVARHDVIRRLARYICAFHQTGLRHRDLYLCHVFVDWPDERQARPTFHVIDLARVFRPIGWTRGRWTVKDLSQLDVSARQIGASRADRLRFLLAYLGLERAGGRVRRLARRVARKSDGILARIARKAPR